MAERKSRRRFLAEGVLALAGVVRRVGAEAAPDGGTPAVSGTGSICSGTPARPPVRRPTGDRRRLRPGGGADARVTMTPGQRTHGRRVVELQRRPLLRPPRLPARVTKLPGMVWNPVLQGTGRMPKRNRIVRSSWTPRKPAGNEELAFAPVHVLARWVQARQVSSVQLTELALARLERYQPQLNCTITLVREQALAEAEAADREIARGKYRGPLHGIPYGVKDLLDTAGIRTTWGAEPFRNRVPKEDATVVARLRAAGAILVAKLSLGALALNDVWFGGRTSNPWFLEEGSGGSSAGSAAAVSAGLVPFAIGSETFGSTVGPCTRCGLTGLRPTFGRVPADGAMTLSWSHDKLERDDPLGGGHGAGARRHLGPGPDGPLLPAEPPRVRRHPRTVKGMRIGFVPAWMGGPKGEPSSPGPCRRWSRPGMRAGWTSPFPTCPGRRCQSWCCRRVGGLVRAPHSLR